MQREARMVELKIVYTRQAQRDAREIAAAGPMPKAEKLLEVLSRNPYQTLQPSKSSLETLPGPIPAGSTFSTASYIKFWKKKEL
jgi:hypothetical protein